MCGRVGLRRQTQDLVFVRRREFKSHRMHFFFVVFVVVFLFSRLFRCVNSCFFRFQCFQFDSPSIQLNHLKLNSIFTAFVLFLFCFVLFCFVFVFVFFFLRLALSSKSSNFWMQLFVLPKDNLIETCAHIKMGLGHSIPG